MQKKALNQPHQQDSLSLSLSGQFACPPTRRVVTWSNQAPKLSTREPCRCGWDLGGGYRLMCQKSGGTKKESQINGQAGGSCVFTSQRYTVTMPAGLRVSWLSGASDCLHRWCVVVILDSTQASAASSNRQAAIPRWTMALLRRCVARSIKDTSFVCRVRKTPGPLSTLNVTSNRIDNLSGGVVASQRACQKPRRGRLTIPVLLAALDLTQMLAS